MANHVDRRDMKKEVMWAITGHYGLYTGTWLRRSDAIRQHTRTVGRTWNECRKQGDEAVRVVMLFIPKAAHE